MTDDNANSFYTNNCEELATAFKYRHRVYTTKFNNPVDATYEFTHLPTTNGGHSVHLTEPYSIVRQAVVYETRGHAQWLRHILREATVLQGCPGAEWPNNLICWSLWGSLHQLSHWLRGNQPS